MHVLAQNTAGQSQPHSSNDHTTAAQTLQDAPSTKQTLTDGQDTIKNASINATDHTPGHKLYQTLENARKPLTLYKTTI